MWSCTIDGSFHTTLSFWLWESRTRPFQVWSTLRWASRSIQSKMKAKRPSKELMVFCQLTIPNCTIIWPLRASLCKLWQIEEERQIVLCTGERSTLTHSFRVSWIEESGPNLSLYVSLSPKTILRNMTIRTQSCRKICLWFTRTHSKTKTLSRRFRIVSKKRASSFISRCSSSRSSPIKIVLKEAVETRKIQTL